MAFRSREAAKRNADMREPPARETERRWFNVLNGQHILRIGFDAVAAHRAQIEYNHGQTLEELSAQGGLDWYELYCGFTEQGLFPLVKIELAEARERVVRMVQEHTLCAQNGIASVSSADRLRARR